jgi:ABC-type branched-subunit amino acid transport system substrate-binding protein
MVQRGVILVLLLAALAAMSIVALACGGGDGDDPTPTPSGPAAATEPAEVIAVFGSPEMVRATLAAGKDAAGVQMFLLASASSGDGQFDAASLPTVLIRGAKLVSTPRDGTFAERFGASYPYDAEYPGFREAYDAVYLVALAALAANSGDPAVVRENLLFVANAPGEVVSASPEGLTRAAEILAVPEDMDLAGAGGLLDFVRTGDGPSFASKAGAETWTIINGAYSPLEVRDVDLVAETGVESPAGELKRGEGVGGTIKIGAIVSLSGADQARGTAIANAMDLATTEINDAGGIGGQQLELVVRDDAGDPAQAITAAADLEREGVVAILGPTTDASATAAFEGLGGDSAAPILTLASSAALAGVTSDRLVAVAPLATAESVVLANLVIEGKFTVGCAIHDGSAASEAMAAVFRQALEYKQGQLREPVAVAGEDYAGAVAACLSE